MAAIAKEWLCVPWLCLRTSGPWSCVRSPKHIKHKLKAVDLRCSFCSCFMSARVTVHAHCTTKLTFSSTKTSLVLCFTLPHRAPQCPQTLTKGFRKCKRSTFTHLSYWMLLQCKSKSILSADGGNRTGATMLFCIFISWVNGAALRWRQLMHKAVWMQTAMWGPLTHTAVASCVRVQVC